MNQRFYRLSGYSLLLGTALIVATMVLHPSGGSLEHIRRITPLLMGSHGLAISSLPLLAFGGYGLTTRLETPSRIATLALIIFCLGLIAGMIAATLNGLALPLFVANETETAGGQLDQVRLIVRYGFQFNKAMSYILVTCLTTSMGIWSVQVLRRHILPNWLGYAGIGLVGVALIGVVSRFDFHAVVGFRLFAFGMASWFAGSGLLLIRTPQAD